MYSMNILLWLPCTHIILACLEDNGVKIPIYYDSDVSPEAAKLENNEGCLVIFHWGAVTISSLERRDVFEQTVEGQILR